MSLVETELRQSGERTYGTPQRQDYRSEQTAPDMRNEMPRAPPAIRTGRDEIKGYSNAGIPLFLLELIIAAISGSKMLTQMSKCNLQPTLLALLDIVGHGLSQSTPCLPFRS